MNDGNENPPVPAPAHAPNPPGDAVPAPPAPVLGNVVELPAPPPAAKAVIEGKTEREIALENKLVEESARAKKAETLAAEKEDEAKRLREAQSGSAPAPKKKKSGGWTFFDQD